MFIYLAMMLLKVPYSGGGLGLTKGTELAPDAIVAKLKNDYLTEGNKIPVFAISDVKIDNADAGKSHNAINEAAAGIKNFIAVGGDHSITYSLLKGFCKTNNESRITKDDTAIVVFDAHPDLMQPFSIPTHENWLRMAIADGILKAENVVLVGCRAVHKEEAAFISSSGIRHFPMKEIAANGVTEVCDSAMAAVKDAAALYVSVDIDVVDPSFAPGTGCPEPAGMTARELIYFIQRLRMMKNFAAADVVEVNPAKDLNEMTVRLAAKVVQELC